ncbi:efflux RND transporter periplasmic adaptor subunit [Roseibium denhamense]|uniref:Membrane fusion protein, multidrug efflux system n=1 Tax=Roseibium denhamense TaxID=76305 RepID=A0ABY1NV04_9HYPH|nr:efflux RND transporter periplasmic adaptor subunit [Roseibium denhamense]MTI05482.1 efflux RND transporter periplasmic adaptor subunit [Roseibium denhamense]SMP18356.1 membrane fusion protein, multidrug efflux system [Roseibium denhamense]
MRIKFSYLLATGIAVGIGIWMSSGTVVVGGVGDGANAVPAPADRVNEGREEAFKVEVAKLVALDRQSVLEVRGRTEAEAKVAVRSETVDDVIRRPAKEGTHVSAGEILCELDPGTREARVLEAKAALAQAQLDHDAASQLVTKGFTAQTRAAQTQALLDAARARLKEAELELERTIIRSPIDGTIESPMAEVGAQLDNGGICATVVNSDPMIAIGQVSELNIGQISIDMPAEVSLVTGETLTGRVRYISPSANPDTRTFRIEVELANPDGTARDGITALTRLALPVEKAHKITPAFLTLSDTGEIGVRAVNADNRTAFYPVTVLGGEEDGLWITGLPDEITVITVGQEYVGDNEIVDPIFKTAEVTQ